jgi:hypothetical protein
MPVLTETWIGVRWLAIEIRLLRSVTRKDSTHWAREEKLLEASTFGFRGWPVNPNLIFGDGAIRRRPQMEVWFCSIAGTYAARHNALMGTGKPEQS